MKDGFAKRLCDGVLRVNYALTDFWFKKKEVDTTAHCLGPWRLNSGQGFYRV